jgi:hypothetical protein
MALMIKSETPKGAIRLNWNILPFVIHQFVDAVVGCHVFEFLLLF